MTSDRGQSETIGAILLVAITVIAVSIVAGTPFAASAPTSHPNARIDATGNGSNVSIEHRAGEPIHEDDFEILLQETGTRLAGVNGIPDERISDNDSFFEPGETWTFDAGYSISDGETVVLIYTSGDRVLLDETTVGIEPTTTEGGESTTTATTTTETTTVAPTDDPPTPTIEEVSDNSCEFYDANSQNCKNNQNAGPTEYVEFGVVWSASDDTGLSTVTIQLENSSGVVQTEQQTISGTTASGSVTLTDTGGYGEVYTIVVTATDANGQSATVSEDHTADGDSTGSPP